jgi:hypothetical protein
MTDNNSLQELDIDNINQKIDMILRQTDYTFEIAREKLKEHKLNEIYVIKEYLLGNNSVNIQPRHVTSINQEIYSQIRSHLNKPNNSDKYLSYTPSPTFPK